MYLIYLDEVKLNPPAQPFQWLCGLAIPSGAMLKIEVELAQIATAYFGNSLLVKETEFHAKEIVHGSGPFKGHAIEKRKELYFQLLEVINAYDKIIKKIEVRIDPTLVQFPRDLGDVAFMYFVERCDSLMKELASTGLLISDSDPCKNSANVKSLSYFRAYSTDYAFGSKIENLVDTIHQTDSHHSRFLQLADIYTYSCALCAKEQTKYFQKTIKEHIRTTPTSLRPDKYKHWPTSQSIWLPKKIANDS